MLYSAFSGNPCVYFLFMGVCLCGHLYLLTPNYLILCVWIYNSCCVQPIRNSYWGPRLISQGLDQWVSPFGEHLIFSWQMSASSLKWHITGESGTAIHQCRPLIRCPQTFDRDEKRTGLHCKVLSMRLPWISADYISFCIKTRYL